ncbi:type II toxin-antitoxin system RelE/ParE family toxin [candidate division KSB1 bacterium]|nr:type II toxin-antitoxin system RelE/ParE family toxin [candidate division KSB1 bacterium]
MKIEILKSAHQDLISGFYFYEKQGKGLGTYFLDTLFSDIDSLQIYAGIHSIHFDKYHRLLSKRFPFAIYYRVEEDMVYIHAVLDCRRNPAWIRKKLK